MCVCVCVCVGGGGGGALSLFFRGKGAENTPTLEKTNNLDFRPGPTKTGINNFRSRLGA